MEGRDRTTVAVALLLIGGSLAFDPWGWQPFGPVKWAVITIAAWTALMTAVAADSEIHGKSGLAWLVVLAWAALTSLTALEPWSAWLGTPDRRFGFVALSTMAAAFAAGQAVDTEKRQRFVVRTLALTLIGMGLYGLAETLGVASVDLTTSTDRLGSTFGSPAYLAAAVVLFLPPCIALALDSDEATRWRRIALAASLAGLALLAGSGTRAALIGLAAAAIVSARQWWPLVQRRRVAVTLAAAAMVGLLALSPLGDRILDAEGSPGAGRVAEWRVAAAAVVERPLLGSGLEGYRVMFPGVVDADYVRAYGRSTVTDRAHSGPLDMTVAMGVVGGLAWLAAAGWLTYRAVVASRPRLLASGLAAGLVGLWAQELFLFPTLEVGVAGWAIAGIVVAAGGIANPVKLRRRGAKGFTALVVVLALVAGSLDVTADHLAEQARSSNELALADRAAYLRPDSFRYALVAADLAARQGRFGPALERVGKARALAPLDPALRLARARLLGAAQTAGDDVLAEMEDMVKADPNHPELRLVYGDALAATGHGSEAEQAWLAAEFLAPTETAAPLRLAYLYLRAGESAAAAAAVERVRLIDPGAPELDELEKRLDEP